MLVQSLEEVFNHFLLLEVYRAPGKTGSKTSAEKMMKDANFPPELLINN